MKIILLCSMLLSLTIVPAKADRLIPEVISSMRSEQAVAAAGMITIINQEDIRASGAATVSDALRGHAGLQITDLRGDGAATIISIRGFDQTANANVLVLIDGMRLNHADTRNPDISHIALNDVERIEIIQGSAGVLYGDQAVGGVVNIITRRPLGRLVDLSMDVGSYGRWATRINAANRLENGFSWRFAAETSHSDGYRDHSVRHFDNLSGYLSYRYHLGEIFLDLKQVSDDLELPGALMQAAYDADRRHINAGFVNDFSRSDSHVVRLGLVQTISSHWSFEGELAQRNTDESLTQSFQNNPSPAGGSTRRDQGSFNPRLIGRFETRHGRAQITMGADIERTEFDLYVPYSFLGIPGAVDRTNNQHTRAIYAQAVVPISDRSSLTAGGRYASVDNRMQDKDSFPAGQDVDDDVFVRTLGLDYQASHAWRIYLRMDENFRFAKVDELTGALPGVILGSQTGLSLETGMQWSDNGRSFNLGLYRLKLRDEIYFDPTVGLWGANTNLDETLRYGLTASGGIDIMEGLRLSADYTYTHATFESGGLDGKTVSGVAPHLLTLKAQLSPFKQWSWLAEWQLVSSKYASGDNLNVRQKAPGYGVLNISGRYNVGHWELALRLNNVTNKQYSEFIADGFVRSYQPSQERNLQATLSYYFQ